MKPGDRILFHPRAAKKPARGGEYLRKVRAGVVEVKLDGDPFTVCVNSEQVTTTSPSETEEVTAMPTTTAARPTAKELRRQAKALGVDGWEEMTLAELRAAIDEQDDAPAKKTTARKTAAKKVAAPEPVDEADEDDEEPAPAPKRTAKAAAAKKAAPARKTAVKAAADEDEDGEEGLNPFRPKTNLYYIAEEIFKGGKRSAMVRRLKKKISLNPRNDGEFDEDAEIDRRVLIVGQLLRKDHGFTVDREGRGADATIVAYKE